MKHNDFSLYPLLILSFKNATVSVQNSYMEDLVKGMMVKEQQ